MAEFVRHECESCHAPIIWAVTAATGRRMPVDFEATPGGNIALRPAPQAPVATVLSVARQFGRTDLRTSHFASCPDSRSWRTREQT